MNKTARDRYPRSLPFNPPQAPPAPAHRPPSTNHRPLLIAGIACALFIAGTAGGIFLFHRGNTPAPANKTPRDERVLETLGSLSAAHLYQSYLNIGLLADAVEKEGVGQEQASDMLATVVSLINVVDKQL